MGETMRSIRKEAGRRNEKLVKEADLHHSLTVGVEGGNLEISLISLVKNRESTRRVCA
jgi:hypothetical protein